MSVTVVSPLATPIAAGALESIVSASAIPDGRFAGDGVWWLGIAAGTALRAFAISSVQRYKNVTSDLPGASSCTLFELSPFPQMAPAAFKQIPGGLPVQLVIVPGDVPTPDSNVLLLAGDALVSAPPGTGSTAYLAFAFQDRLCRDALSWADAIAASGIADPSWTQLRSALAALSGTDTLRVLDHRGQPVTQGGVTVQIGTAAAVTVNPVNDGDTHVGVAPAAQAKVTFSTATAPLVARAGADDGALNAPLILPAGKRLVQVMDVSAWLAPRDAGVLVHEWTANNLVEPIVDGTPYFARLVDDMRAAKPGGAVQLAGWTFRKGSLEDSTAEWPLIPGDITTRMLALVAELRAAGVPMKFLVNKFLQLNGPTLDDAIWLMPLLMMASGVWALLMASGALAKDPKALAAGMMAIPVVTAAAMSSLAATALEDHAETSKAFVAALNAIDPQLYTWTPYPAAFGENPIVTTPFTVAGVVIDDVDHVGVYHQKYVGIRRNDGSYVAYVGGIDINSDRIDTPLHRAVHPFHDVQLRISGPAVEDVVTSFEERLHRHDPSAAAPIAHASLPAIPAAGAHVVQIARTYFKHGSSSTPPFAFAPNGETTPVRTLLKAIAQAKDFIYIEDQYFTPPDDYVQALLDAGEQARGVRALFVTVPYQTDQPYGWLRRADMFAALRTKWGDRFKLGTPVRRYLDVTPGLVTNSSRARLAAKLMDTDATATLSPVAHLPKAPFFAFVEGELILFHAEDGAPTGTGDTSQQKYDVTRTVQANGWGASPVEHDEGAPVLGVRIPGIYVHAKLMIVDDVFLFAGSSNLNRRGLYHDGEMDAFAIPQHLLGDPRNPARVLRSRLMAEHIGITPEIGLSLFADPFAVMPFLSRSWYQGAHRVPMEFFDAAAPLGISIKTSESKASEVLDVLIAGATDLEKKNIWKMLVDPLSESAPAAARTPGPGYP